MKKLFRSVKYLLLVIILAFIGHYSKAQFLKKLKDKVTQTASDHVTNDAGNATDKTMNKTEGATTTNGGNSSPAGNSSNSSSGNSAAASSGKSSAPPSIKTYKNYDFVPGNKIIFQSNLAADQTGSLPSQFTVTDGQMDVQTQEGENAIHVPTGSGAKFSPRMTSTNYLPDQFTIEFDVKNEKAGLEHLNIKSGDEDGNIIDISLAYGVSWTTGSILPPEDLHLNYDYPMKWNHIAIAIIKTRGKFI